MLISRACYTPFFDAVPAISSTIFPFSGGIEKLALLLSSNVEHVLVNVVNALRVLSESSPENQKVIGESNAIPVVIELIGTCLTYSYFVLFIIFYR